MNLHDYIKSPLNYTGGKYKILKYILPMFPGKINTFIDLFAGGFNVGINIDAQKIICNDQITYLVDMLRYLRETEIIDLLFKIYGRIAQFSLSDVNEIGYNSLRDTYNLTRDPLDLFILTCYSFNHQIRFNSKHCFNTPFGRRRSTYNSAIENNLIEFCNALKGKNIEFFSSDFASLDLTFLSNDDFIYCDPPYLISTGSYNDGTRGFKNWTLAEERTLLNLLDNIDQRGIKFALSNVLLHKGQSNDLLIQWSEKYTINYIDKKYSNCSYHYRNRMDKTVEVLITNYRMKGLFGYENGNQNAGVL